MNAPPRSGSAARLYTPDLLALAVGLANYPLHEGFPLHGQARSQTCGSTLELGLAIDANSRIDGVGMAVAACAVGQAAAAIFASACSGLDESSVRAAHDELQDWLGGRGELPDWPGIDALEPAREHSGRHTAILLPWIAAIRALSMAPAPR